MPTKKKSNIVVILPSSTKKTRKRKINFMTSAMIRADQQGRPLKKIGPGYGQRRIKTLMGLVDEKGEYLKMSKRKLTAKRKKRIPRISQTAQQLYKSYGYVNFPKLPMIKATKKKTPQNKTVKNIYNSTLKSKINKMRWDEHRKAGGKMDYFTFTAYELKNSGYVVRPKKTLQPIPTAPIIPKDNTITQTYAPKQELPPPPIISQPPIITQEPQPIITEMPI